MDITNNLKLMISITMFCYNYIYNKFLFFIMF